MATSIVLVCAVFASLAAGVLVAYGVCVSMFEIFRIHSTQVRAARAAAISQVSQVTQVSATQS